MATFKPKDFQTELPLDKLILEDQPETEASKPAKAKTQKVGVKPKAKIGLLQAIRSFFL